MIVPTYETTAREQEMIINELRSINRTQENRINIQKEEIERLNNIIKEAREYIEIIVKNTPSSTRKDYANMLLIDYKKLLEILDKGE